MMTCHVRHLFVDASWENGLAGLAAVALNLLDKSWSYNLVHSKAASAMEAETKAVKLGLEWAAQDSSDHFILLSDCKVVVEALGNRWLLGVEFIPDLELLLKEFIVF
uniref:RNase H type-1 domain-containing protein n=1 Tax=Cannabis sativa TaxID=3483 RepID=A0A803QAE4_CANSA